MKILSIVPILFLLFLQDPTEQGPNLENVTEVLLWLTGVGAPFLVGYLLSLVAENIPSWHNLPRQVKFSVPLVASVLIAGGAQLLLQNEVFIARVAPLFSTIVRFVLTYLGTQQAYLAVKKTEEKGYYGDSAKVAAKTPKAD